MLNLTHEEQQTMGVALPNPLPVTAVITTNPVGVRDTWRVALTQDETADDSDKIFTVPAAVEWQILWVWVELTTTAVVGARQLEIQIQDAAADIIARWQAGVTQTASLTYNYLFGIAMPDLTAVRDTNFMITPLPAGTFLAAGQIIRIWDNVARDPTHDDMIIQMQYASRAV